jgi:hypothetical protein
VKEKESPLSKVWFYEFRTFILETNVQDESFRVVKCIRQFKEVKRLLQRRLPT